MSDKENVNIRLFYYMNIFLYRRISGTFHMTSDVYFIYRNRTRMQREQLVGQEKTIVRKKYINTNSIATHFTQSDVDLIR